MPVHRRAEAVEELTRLAEGRVPGGLSVVGGSRLDVLVESFPGELATEPVRLAGPADTGHIGARHRRVVVARPARELDSRGRALRQAGDVAVRVAEHRVRDLAVRREAAGEEERPVATVVERRLAEVEDDDAALVPACRRAALGGEDPWLRAVLVDRERRRPQAMLRMGLGVRLGLRLRRLPLRPVPLRSVPVLRLVRRLLVVPKFAKRLQPHAGVRREAGNQAVDVAAGHHRGLSLGVMALGRMTFGQGAAGEAEGEGESSGDGEQIPLQKDLPTDFAGKIRARVAGYFAARGPPLEGDGSGRRAL